MTQASTAHCLSAVFSDYDSKGSPVCAGLGNAAPSTSDVYAGTVLCQGSGHRLLCQVIRVFKHTSLHHLHPCLKPLVIYSKSSVVFLCSHLFICRTFIVAAFSESQKLHFFRVKKNKDNSKS